MRIRFVKMNGAGNDFVMIDNRDLQLDPVGEDIRSMCDRRRGVGADGVILIDRADDADFDMRYYNSDGGEVEMCGNGARCAALFASALGLGKQEDFGLRLRFRAMPGLFEARVSGARVAIHMTDASDCETNISLSVAGRSEKVHFINTGVPHVVVVEDDTHRIPDEEILARGRALRNHERFAPSGTNANFISKRADGALDIRTYERGVEGETLACGTGAVAGAVVAGVLGLTGSPVTLYTHGGERLTVTYDLTDGGASEVVLEGPAAVNFEGVLELERRVRA